MMLQAWAIKEAATDLRIYDVTKAGDRFMYGQAADRAVGLRVRVITNWPSRLRSAPARQ